MGIKNVIGRCINVDDERDVVGYRVKDIDTSDVTMYTVEEMAFLIGNGKIANCTLQFYKDKVIFRGQGIALESLPTIKVQVIKRKTGAVDLIAMSNQQVATKKEHKSGQAKIKEEHKETSNELAKMLSTVLKKYGFCAPDGMHFSKQIREDGAYLNIVNDLTCGADTDNKKHWEYVVDASDNEYYYLRQTDFINDFIIKIKKSEGIEKFYIKALPFMGLIQYSDFEKVECIDDSSEVVFDAFERYSGNSNEVLSPLKGIYGTAKDTGFSESRAPLNFLSTYVMLLRYRSIKSSKPSKLALFRGDRRGIKEIQGSNPNKTFMSFSYVGIVAAEFSSGKTILYVEDAPINLLLNVENIAVMDDEFEILMNMMFNIDVIGAIGKYNGATIYKVKITRAGDNASHSHFEACLNQLIRSYEPYAKRSLLVHTCIMLAKHCIKDFNQVEFQGLPTDICIIHGHKNNRHITIDISEGDNYELHTGSFEVYKSDRTNYTVNKESDIGNLIKYINGE